MHRKLGFAIVLSMLAAALPAAAQPYLQIRAIYLEETHEDAGWLGNDPEIELYKAQSPYYANNYFQGDPIALAVFNGGYVTGVPSPGWKPDINDKGKWYTLSPAYTIPATTGLGILLVEDDDYRGHWVGSSSFTSGFLCNLVIDPTLPAGITYCQNPAFSGSDDVFRGMLVVTGAAALGMPETTIDLGQWRVKVAIGY